MTYLEAVNSVLRRLREDQAATVLESSYSALIGDIVNDAKKIVENAWNWTSLRGENSFNTVAGVSEYSLSGSGMNAVIKHALNDTTNTDLTYQPKAYFDAMYYNQTPASGSPKHYTFVGTDASDNLKIKLYPQPEGIYTLRFQIANTQGLLTADADKLNVPSHPVVQLAFAMALRERGETGGQSAVEQFAVASTALSDAVALDANKYPEETTYMVV